MKINTKEQDKEIEQFKMKIEWNRDGNIEYEQKKRTEYEQKKSARLCFV